MKDLSPLFISSSKQKNLANFWHNHNISGGEGSFFSIFKWKQNQRSLEKNTTK